MTDESIDPTASEPSRATGRARTVVVVVALVVVAVVVAGTVVALRVVGDDSATAAGPAMVEVTLADADLSIAYPEAWDRLEPPDELTQLLVTPNGQDSLLVRTVELNTTVEPDQIDGVRDFTEELVTDGTDVDVVTGPQRVELAGVAGWHYLYRFEDAASGEVGVHSHYFLFDGSRMVVLVFQALPAERFDVLAPTFDAISESLRLQAR